MVVAALPIKGKSLRPTAGCGTNRVLALGPMLQLREKPTGELCPSSQRPPDPTVGHPSPRPMRPAPAADSESWGAESPGVLCSQPWITQTPARGSAEWIGSHGRKAAVA